MQTKNVYYSQQPDRVLVAANGSNARIDFPINVTEVETEDGVQYLAETVYTLETKNVSGLKERIEDNYDAWLEMAKVVKSAPTEMSDVVEAINTLTDIVLGGDF